MGADIKTNIDGALDGLWLDLRSEFRDLRADIRAARDDFNARMDRLEADLAAVRGSRKKGQ